MKKILGLVLYAALMFGVTAGLGMFMMKKTAPAPHVDAEDGEHQEDAHATSEHDSETSHESTAEASISHSDSHGISSDSPTHSDEQLPVAVRSSPMSVEEIVRMGLSLKSRDEALRVREQALRDADSQHRLIQTDVEGAQQQVENLLARASDQRAAIQELVARIDTQKEAISHERLALTNEKQQLKTDRETLIADQKQMETQKQALATNETDLQLKRKELDLERAKLDGDRNKLTADSEKLRQDREKWVTESSRMNEERQKLKTDQEQLDAERLIFEQDKRLLASTSGAAAISSENKLQNPPIAKMNVPDLATMLEGLSAEKAASQIKVFVENGQIETVAQVLKSIEERQATAIVEAIPDEKLVNEILKAIGAQQAAPKTATK